MSDAINITKILRPSLRGAVSPSLARASFSGGFFIMRSDTSNTTSSSRSKLEQLKKDLPLVILISLTVCIVGTIFSIHLEAYVDNFFESTLVLANNSECLQANDLIINLPKCLI